MYILSIKYFITIGTPFQDWIFKVMKNKKESADIDRSVLGVRDCLWSRL